MRQAGFEPAIPARELPQANALDLTAAGIGSKSMLEHTCVPHIYFPYGPSYKRSVHEVETRRHYDVCGEYL